MTYDAPYQETDRISPHFSHMIQPLDEGAWQCLDCEPLMCHECEMVAVKDEDELCGECLSQLASYYHPEDGGQS